MGDLAYLGYPVEKDQEDHPASTDGQGTRVRQETVVSTQQESKARKEVTECPVSPANLGSLDSRVSRASKATQDSMVLLDFLVHLEKRLADASAKSGMFYKCYYRGEWDQEHLVSKARRG